MGKEQRDLRRRSSRVAPPHPSLFAACPPHPSLFAAGPPHASPFAVGSVAPNHSAVRHRHGQRANHSYRSAATGSSLDALSAGSMPKTIPVTALEPSAATTASGGTDAWMGVYLFTSSATI